MKKSFQNGGSVSDPAGLAFSRSALGRTLLGLSTARSGANRTVAGFLLRDPIRISAWSIEEFAANAGVSTASVSRFARAAGFSNFPELRNALAATLSESLHPVEKLRRTFAADSDLDSAFGGGLEATSAGIQRLINGIGASDLRPAVDAISQARTVYVMGFGLSAHLAGLLTLNLQPFLPRLVNIVQFGGTEVAAGRLAALETNDLLIAISFPRYARDALDLTHFAREHGAKVVAITDSSASPLSRLADVLLTAPSSHPVLSMSAAPALVLVEALVSAFMLSNPENVRHAARLTDAISQFIHRDET